MDRNAFKENHSGRLVKITIQGENDWAFVPDTPPQEWQLPIEHMHLLIDAHKELARLDGIGRHMPAYNLLLRPLQQREALKSSSLEGTYATPEQLLLFELDPKEPKTKSDKINAWKEVSNYGEAIRIGRKTLEEIPVSIRLIKILHKELLEGVRGQHRDPGNFRRSQVHIGSDRRFVPPPPQEAIECLNELELFIHDDDKEIDPLIFCFIVHYQFEAIHPFLDGNGRVGRLLLSLMIYQWCQLTNPWLYLSAFFDKYKDEYITNLFNISTKGDWLSWIVYCLRGTIYQAKDAIKRYDKLVELRDDYMNRLSRSGGNVRLNKVIDELFEFPAMTTPRLRDMLGISYPTARRDIKTLSELGILRETVSKRPEIFFSPEIMDIAYRDFLD